MKRNPAAETVEKTNLMGQMFRARNKGITPGRSQPTDSKVETTMKQERSTGDRANSHEFVKDCLEAVLKAENAAAATEKYKEAGRVIAGKCKPRDEDIGILFLTPDQKVLEGVGWSGTQFETLSPVDIPFYRLDWDVAPGYENLYDGFTSWLAVHLKPGQCDIRTYAELREHPAHKGRWDPVVWAGDPDRGLQAIMSTVIGSEGSYGAMIGSKDPDGSPFRLHGVLKVERRWAQSRIPEPFIDEDRQKLLAVAAAIRDWLDGLSSQDERKFWQIHVRLFAERKAAELTAVLRRGRSLDYNLGEAIGFIVEIFRQRLGAERGLHFFASEAKGVAHLMPYWRPAWRRNVSWAQIERTRCRFRTVGEQGTAQCTFNEAAVKACDSKNCPWRWSSPCPRLIGAGRKPFAVDRRTEYGQLAVPSPQVLTGVLKREWSQGPFSARTTRTMGIVIEMQEKNAEKLDTERLVVEVKQGGSVAGNESLPLPEWSKLIRLSGGGKDFGTIMVPLTDCREGRKREEEEAENNELAATAATLARVLDAFLTSQYDVPPESTAGGIYLPKYRAVGPRKVALLFADIRNMTRMTQILRLMGQGDAVQLLMDFYCLVMARVIARWGRRDKFMGDGVMAIFGEDCGDDEEKRKALLALCCACEMAGVFERLRAVWLGLRGKKLLPGELPWRYPGKTSEFAVQGLSRIFNEDIVLGFGIGINYGEVYFDYFGDVDRREYTCIGDHVNFAARLAHAADRRQNPDQRATAPILLSQTVWNLLSAGESCLIHPKEGSEDTTYCCWPLRLAMPGLSFDYPVYEMSPHLLNLPRAQQAVGEGRRRYCTAGDEEASFDQEGNHLRVAEKRLVNLGL